MTEDCFMIDFAMKRYRNYQPMDGYGYYKLTNQEAELDPSLSAIFMDEVPIVVTNALRDVYTHKILSFIEKNGA